MKFALCDDDEKFTLQLRETVSLCMDEHGVAFRTDLFTSGTDFLNSHTDYDIVFMDIYLGTENGIEIAENWARSHDSLFIFISTSREYAVEAFSLNAAHYLVKPCTDRDVRTWIDRCLARLKTHPDAILELKTHEGTVPIPESSIIYAEVFNKTLVVHALNGDFTSRTPLDTVARALDPARFLRIQRSYLVNMHFIDVFSSDHVVLKNGVTAGLSRKNRSQLKKQYQRYLFAQARKEIP